MTVTVSQAKV